MNTNGKGKPWSEDEIGYLNERWGELSIARIARKLKRPINGVKLKARREGLMRFSFCIDGITLGQLAKVFNVEYSGTVKRIWVDQLKLPYKAKVTAEQRAYRYICIDDFWKWACCNRQQIDFSKLEKHVLGKEPCWVEQKRKADSEKFSYRLWTEDDDAKLRSLLKQHRYTYKEISDRLQRSEGSIKYYIRENGILERPIPTDKKAWTADEINTVIKMKRQGYASSSIANEIKRTARAIDNKLVRLTEDDNYAEKLAFLRKGNSG